MRKRVCVATVATIFAAFTAFGQTTTGQQSSKAKAPSAKQFLTAAAQGSQAEIQMGKLAEQRGMTPKVKQLGAKLVSDHTTLYQQIQQVASAQNITIPNTPSSQQQKEIQRLSSLSGEQFDREFLTVQEKEHTKDIKMFQLEAKNTANPQVAQLAQNAIPVLQSHMQMSEQAMAALPGGARKTPATDSTGYPQK